MTGKDRCAIRSWAGSMPIYDIARALNLTSREVLAYADSEQLPTDPRSYVRNAETLYRLWHEELDELEAIVA